MEVTDGQAVLCLVIAIIVLAIKYGRRGWAGSGNAHGTATWASESDLEHAGMLSGNGMILGRTTMKGKLITINTYTHLMVTAPTGAGKGVSFVIPTLLTYTRGSVFVNDPKGELYKSTADARRRMGNVYVIDPFHLVTPPGRSDCFNPLSTIRPGSTLGDESLAMADALIEHAPEGDRDPFWNNSAKILLNAMICATTLMMKPGDRNFSTVRELLTDPVLFKEAIKQLQSLGGIPARLGNQLARQSESEKESAGVISTAHTHTSFIDSESVAAVINSNTFSADVLLEPGSTIYFILPVEHLDAQRGFTRLMVSTFLRYIMRNGVKGNGETLFLLDECAAALSGLDSLAQAFVLGRAKGIRLYTFWQTLEQAQAAFKKTPNLVLDNSDAQVFFGVNSFATADLISKILGTWTMISSKASQSDSGGRSHTSMSAQGTTYQRGWSQSLDYSEHGRPLLNPAEIIQISGDYLIALVKGCPPIFGRRLKYYADPLFRGTSPKSSSSTLWWWWLLLVAAIGLLVWGLR